MNPVFGLESLEAVRGVNSGLFGNFFQPKLLFMMSSLTYFMYWWFESILSKMDKSKEYISARF